MGFFKNYDPGRYVAVWNGIQVQGFAPDSFIAVSRNTDAFSDDAGSQGDVVNVRSRDKRGKVVFTLMQASPTNDQFAAKVLADEATGLGYGPLLIKDLNGTTVHECTNARLSKMADDERGNKAGTYKWTLLCAELKMFSGGAVV